MKKKKTLRWHCQCLINHLVRVYAFGLQEKDEHRHGGEQDPQLEPVIHVPTRPDNLFLDESLLRILAVLLWILFYNAINRESVRERERGREIETRGLINGFAWL